MQSSGLPFIGQYSGLNFNSDMTGATNKIHPNLYGNNISQMRQQMTPYNLVEPYEEMNKENKKTEKKFSYSNNNLNNLNNLNNITFDSIFNDKKESSEFKQNLNQKLDQTKSKYNRSEIRKVIDPITGETSISIIVEKKILEKYKDSHFEFTSKFNSQSESASICSQEEKDNFLKKRKRNNNDDSSYNEKESTGNNETNKNGVAKKKLRVASTNLSNNSKPKNINKMYYNFDIPSRTTLTYNDLNEQDLEMINKIDYPRRKKVKEKSFNDEGGVRTAEKSQMLKVELNQFFPSYKEELEKALQNKYHIFMKNNFPPMYNLENFYLYVHKLNKVRGEYKQCIRLEKKDKLKVLEEKMELEVSLVENNNEIEKINKNNFDKEEIVYKKEEDNNMINNSEFSIEDKKGENICKKVWDCNKKESYIGNLFYK